MNNPADLLREVTKVLDEALPGVTVGDSLPDGASLMDSLPVVVVDILPGETNQTAWTGDGLPVILDRVPVDIEVFDRSRASAWDTAVKVRPLLYQLPHISECAVTGVDCPQFATREDINPQVKAIGVVADLDTRP